MTENKVRLERVEFGKNTLFVNRMFEYSVSTSVQREATRVLTGWFKKARLSLRVQGGDAEFPFIKAGVRNGHPRRYHVYSSDDFVLKRLDHKDFLNENNERICPLRDIILKNKIDLKSISIVMQPIRHGDQKLSNITSRFRKEYRPSMMYMLLDADTLEDS